MPDGEKLYCAPKDGGSSPGCVPQDLLGVLLRSNASVPPLSAKLSGSQVLALDFPLTLSDCT